MAVKKKREYESAPPPEKKNQKRGVLWPMFSVAVIFASAHYFQAPATQATPAPW